MIGSQTINLGQRSGYTATTTNATNKITAVAVDESAAVSIIVNGTEHVNGTAATWNVGENLVEIIVTNGTAQRIYEIVVEKS